MNPSTRVGILGAGVIGLTSGVEMLRAGWKVTIISREQTPRTTSDVAAGFWFPFKVGNNPRSRDWAIETRAKLTELANDLTPGISIVPLQLLQREWQPDIKLPDGVDGANLSSPDDLPVGFSQGIMLQVPLIDTPIYMPWLQSEFIRLGGKIECRMLRRVEDICGEFGLIINCPGVDARSVATDDSVFPIRGQVVRVTRPLGLSDRIVLHEEEGSVSYIVPRSRDCILGGTAQQGNPDLAPDPAIAGGIIQRCLELEPRLRAANVLEHKVGLRPGRHEVRLELDTRNEGAPIIHHYGHGGSGFTLAWGGASEVVRIAASLLEPAPANGRH